MIDPNVSGLVKEITGTIWNWYHVFKNEIRNSLEKTNSLASPKKDLHYIHNGNCYSMR